MILFTIVTDVGGGGYTLRNVPRCWAYETSVLLDTPIKVIALHYITLHCIVHFLIVIVTVFVIVLECART